MWSKNIGLPDVNHDGYFVKKPVFASTYNVIIVSDVCILIDSRYSKFNRWMPLEMSYKFWMLRNNGYFV